MTVKLHDNPLISNYNYFYLYRTYEDPSPLFRVVSDSISSLIVGIQSSLRRGINLNCKFNVEFRLDVFNYLFSGKGSVPPSGQGKFYSLDNFNPMFFLLIGLLYMIS